MGVSTLAVGRFCCWRRFEDGASSARFMPQKRFQTALVLASRLVPAPFSSCLKFSRFQCREGYSRRFLKTPLGRRSPSFSSFSEAFILRRESNRRSPWNLRFHLND
jgi:hypothetical protein